MSETRASLEVIAPSVEEAVAKGLKDLGITEDAVDVEVLDAGSRGLFGLGSRQARVRLTIKKPFGAEKPLPAAERPVEPERRPAAKPAEPERPAVPVATTVEREAEPVEAELELEEELEDEYEDDFDYEYEDEDEDDEAYEDEAEDESGDDFALQIARETVTELLEKMKVQAEVTAHYGEKDDARSRRPLKVDVQGNDLSILIGPRAETLNALQYIASLIVGKELGRSIPLVVDVQGYRARREQQIRNQARQMAEQAVKTGRRQMLEPMPANERRLVHIELRKDPRVSTESVGEEPRRKVTVSPVEE